MKFHRPSPPAPPRPSTPSPLLSVSFLAAPFLAAPFLAAPFLAACGSAGIRAIGSRAVRAVLLIMACLATLGLAGCSAERTETPESLATPNRATEPAPLLARRSFFSSTDVHAVRLSPDGRRVSWVGAHQGVPNLWLLDLDAPGDDPARGDGAAAGEGSGDGRRPVTRDTGRGIYFYEWAADGRHLLYLQDRAGDESWRLFALDLETERARPLTPEGVRARILGTSPLRPSQVLIGLHQRDPRVPDLYLVDLSEPESKPELVVENDGGFSNFVLDEALRPRFAERLRDDGGASYFELRAERGARTGQWVERFVVGAEDQITTDLLSVAGDTTYWRDSRGRDTAALVAIDISTGEERELYRHPRADVEEVLFDPRTGEPEAVLVTFARRQWTALQPAIEPVLDRVSSLDDGELVVAGRSLDDRRWLVADVSPTRPAAYRLWDVETGRARFLFHDRPELEGGDLAAMHAETIPARDGLELPSYLTLPIGTDVDDDGRPERPLPMVLLVHGGPWSRDVYVNHPQHQHLANRGYAVLSPNYRGSRGFGKAFLAAGDLEWGAAMQDDLVDAVKWAVEQGVADPERVAIMGASYGGYATLMGLVRDPERFACGIDIVGPSNLLTLAGSFPPRWQPRLEIWARRMGDWRTEEGRALLEQRSPLSRVDRLEDPLLILHGANDSRVTLAESEQIVAALEEKGIPAIFAVFPDEGHTFRRPPNVLATLALTEHFLADCLGGRVEPFDDVLEGTRFEVRAGLEEMPALAEALARRDARAGDRGADDRASSPAEH